MLFMRRLSCGRGSRLEILGRQREEDLFEAHAHRTKLQESPSAVDDGSCEIAPDIAPAFSFHFVPGYAVATIGLDHACDAGKPPERVSHVAVRRLHLHIHRLRTSESRCEVVWRIDRNDATL